MSDLIERLASEVRQRPVIALAATGLVGAIVVSRLRADEDDRPSAARLARRGADAVGRGAEAVGRGAALAEQVAEQVARRVGESARRNAHAVGEHTEEAGSRVRAAGSRAQAEVSSAVDDLSLPELLRELLVDRFKPSRTEQVRQAAASVGITEKTVSVFAATLLAKSVSSYLSWRGEERARLQSQALASASDESYVERLEDHTVVELRQLAADRDVEGRSAMNKDELIEALGT